MSKKYISEVELIDLIFPVSSSKSVSPAFYVSHRRIVACLHLLYRYFHCKGSDDLHYFDLTSLDHYSYERPELVHKNETSSLPSNVKKKFTFEQLLSRDDVFPDRYNLNHLQSRFKPYSSYMSRKPTIQSIKIK